MFTKQPAERFYQRLNIKIEELGSVAFCFIYNFSLLTSYYILRPIRDSMGIIAGVEKLQWLFTATFISMLLLVPLFGWLSSRYTRRQFIIITYVAFSLCLLLFFFSLLLSPYNVWVARCFFVFVSVYNLFVVSLFWSLMTDLFTNEQSQRLFPVIAAGGTGGAIIGPSMTVLLVNSVGLSNLVLLSIAFMGVSIYCVLKLTNNSNESNVSNKNSQSVIGGKILDGIKLVWHSSYLQGVSLLIILYSTTSTFLYFQQATIIKSAVTDPTSRTLIFSLIDFFSNILTLFIQLFISAKLIKKFGFKFNLAIIPFAVTIGLISLSLAPILIVIMIIQIIRRAGYFAIMRPARENLYVIRQIEEKYKAKNFIDTTVYRTSDAASAWVYSFLGSLGLPFNAIALIGAILSVAWLKTSLWLGKEYMRGEKTKIDSDMP